MENEYLPEKLIEFAKGGKGRRLLNALNRKNNVLTSFELDKVLNTYCEIGLPKEVMMLKKRRGILSNKQHDALAEKVKENCCSEKYDDFAVSLKNLLSSGMQMNPTKENTDGIA